MKMGTSVLRATALGLLLASLQGCTTVASAINFTDSPVKMYQGPIKADEEISVIYGQAYSPQLGNWIQINIRFVDGKEVYNELTSLRLPYIVETTPGEHEISLFPVFGNRAASTYMPNLPKLSIKVEAGQAYQVVQQLVEKDNATVVRFKLVHVGSLAQVRAYIAQHPQYVKGSPLPILKDGAVS